MNYIIFGESHGPAVGVTVSGVKPGLALDLDFIAAELARRAPGKNRLSTARREADEVELLSGVYEGKTAGTPICAVIKNTDTRSEDYAKLSVTPRPSHADYAGAVRYKGFNDPRGGGHFSGRLTAPLVFAGALAKLALRELGISVSAEISNVAGIPDPTPEQLEAAVLAARNDGDSVGGIIRCTVLGMPVGMGEPDLGRNAEGIFSQHLFAVPAVKAVAFGTGFGFASMRGSEANDAFT
ncbi:MAG: chorismate synthase, partial [Opitutae bacterium]|nr:chorismate synthase [Opitutae bacterium]